MTKTKNRFIPGLIAGCIAAMTFASTSANAENGDTLKAVKERGSLLCSGHNGSFPPFVQVTDDNKWSGYDIDYLSLIHI